MDFITWLSQHWVDVLNAFTGIVAGASVIVASARKIADLTATEVDNKILDAMTKILDILAINPKVEKK